MSSRISFAVECLQLRRWERDNLPLEGSSIALDVFLSLSLFAEDPSRNGDSSLKSLYLSLPFSEQGVRLHLRRLEALGLIELRKPSPDSRMRSIQLSPDYWYLFDAYKEQSAWRYRPAHSI